MVTVANIHSHATIAVWLDKAKEIALQPARGPKERLGRLRAWSVAELIYSSGLRLTHISSMSALACNVESKVVMVDDRVVPITSAAASAVKHWLDESKGYWGAASPHLFAAAMAPHQPMQAQGYATDLALMSGRVGLKLSELDFRHACVREMIRRGMRVSYMAYITGLSVETLNATAMNV